MDHDTDGDGAINLSTSQRPSASTTPNGDGPLYGQDQHEKDQVIIIIQYFITTHLNQIQKIETIFFLN